VRVSFYMETDHKHTHKFCMKSFMNNCTSYGDGAKHVGNI